MEKTRESTGNASLTASCNETHSSCCKDGYIFLPRSEFKAIEEFLSGKPIALEEFLSRITDYGSFLLYNQKTRCQFLQEDELCELHPLGTKPTECFWWPAHVYLSNDGHLEIRIASCCSGCTTLKSDSPHIKKVREQAKKIGFPILRSFRKIHSYGPNYRVVARLE